MADNTLITKPIAAAVGVAFVSSLAVSTTAVADDNPFAMADLDSGYLLADSHEGSEGIQEILAEGCPGPAETNRPLTFPSR